MQEASLTRTNLRTPKAAAIAGMLFSLLTVAAFWLFWISVPADPQDLGSWLSENSKTVALGLNLIPFAGIAFLWFIGVLRDRLGELEDRFFATVFFGSHQLLRWTIIALDPVLMGEGERCQKFFCGWRDTDRALCTTRPVDLSSRVRL